MGRYRFPQPPASEITPRELFESRRRFLRQGAGLAVGALLPLGLSRPAWGWQGGLQGAEPSPYSTDERLTPLGQITTYNNFFEFGTAKHDPYNLAGRLRTDPWSVTISGEVGKPGVYALEDIVRPHTLEERIYRLRCVEAWSKVVPWIGFPLGDLLERFEPTSRARYVVFESVYDPDRLPGQRRDILDWPYREGLRIDEAVHPLTILAVGLYGEVLPNQSGAPLRLVVPWKYGFKSIKSIVRIHLQESRPVSSWEAQLPAEYGFYANVNPAVAHPRWSQARERRLGVFGRRETLPFNGYAEQVAHLYTGMDLQQHF